MRIAALLCLCLPAAVASAQADPAADHYRAGVAHFKAGRFPEAIAEFRTADALRPSPALAFNIAQCFEKMADLPNAKVAYQDYLRRAPDADDRRAVETTIASIDAKLAQARQERTVMVVPVVDAAAKPAAAPRGGPPNLTLAAVATGVGVAGLVAAIVLNAASQQASQSLQNNGLQGRFYTADVLTKYHDDAANFWTGALIGYVAGGVLAIGGVTLGGIQLANAQ